MAAARPRTRAARRARPGPADRRRRRRAGRAARRRSSRTGPGSPGHGRPRRPAPGGGAGRRRPVGPRDLCRRRRHRRGHRARPGRRRPRPARPARAAARPGRRPADMFDPAGRAPTLPDRRRRHAVAGRGRGARPATRPAAARPAGARADDALAPSRACPSCSASATREQLRPRSRAGRPRAARDRLRVPIGLDADGEPVELDLKESAQDGMGPHGLVIGATGSGKSELLRTLVLGLALTHSSEAAQLRPGRLQGRRHLRAALERLPHTSAVITNLADELPLVDRMRRRDQRRADAPAGAAARGRQLRAACATTSGPGSAGTALAPLPSLLRGLRRVLRAALRQAGLHRPVRPDRPAGPVARRAPAAGQPAAGGGAAARTGHPPVLPDRAADLLRSWSRGSVLGVPDAYELPRTPGHGYLRAGTDRAGPVQGRVRLRRGYRPPGRPGGRGRRGYAQAADLTTASRAGAPSRPPAAAPAGHRGGRRESARPAGRAARRAGAAGAPGLAAAAGLHRPPWTSCCGPISRPGTRAAPSATRSCTAPLQVPVAVVDKPFEQRRDLLWLALAGAAGHVAVVGAPRAAASPPLLRTLICALALTHTPAEAQFYCLDFGGGTLAALRDLPHVGGVSGRADDDRGTPDRRRDRHPAGRAGARASPSAGIESMAAWRRRRAAALAGEQPGTDPFGDVFLVVDGWNSLRGDYEDLEPLITELATRGLAYGVHVVLDRAALVRLPAGDPGPASAPASNCASVTRPIRRWSARVAATVPEERPGRGMTAGRAAFPRRRTPDRRRLGGQTTDAGQGGRAGRGPGRRRPGCGCCPPVLPYARAGPERQHRAWPSRSGWPRRTCARWCWTSPPTRTSWSSATPSAASRVPARAGRLDHQPVHPRAGPGARWSTTGAACWARSRRRT